MENKEKTEKELVVIPHNGKSLEVAVFGPNTYKENLKEIRKTDSHPRTREKITFIPTTTSESVSAAAYDFGSNGKADAKRDIFDPRWFQAGYIVRTSDGVFTNTTITDKSHLKQLLDNAEKVNGIYLLNNKIGFAHYESFERGVQDCDTFAQGGLARVLEYTSEKYAPKLREIASPKFYEEGVSVWGFDEVKEPVLRVASLQSNWSIDSNKLNIGGDCWDDSYANGCTFGVKKGDTQ